MANGGGFVVDCDSHVLEPADLWETYLEPAYRERAIKIRPAADGTEQLIVDGKVLLDGRLASLGGVEWNATELFLRKELPYSSGCPRASWDPQARLALLDDWRVDGCVAFPTVGIVWDKDEDPALGMAYARAYNRWLWDFAGGALNRIAPIAHVPLYDPAAALVELKRCLALGFKGMFLAPERVAGKRPSHPDFDPLWATLEEAGLPVCVHLIVRFDRNVTGAIGDWYDKGEPNTVFSFAMGGPTQLMPCAASLICDGLFDRFPRLKVAIVEAGAGFAGFLMDRMDSKFERFGTIATRRRPSEYVRENFWFVMDPGERGIDAQCDLVGETQLLWGSDYPHIDSHLRAAEEVRASLAGTSERRRRLILGENAKKLFAF